MKVLFIIGHPGQANVFRNVIKELESLGHSYKVVARDKECIFDLLKAYKIDFEPLDIHYKSMIGKVIGLFRTDIGLYKICRRFKPDLLVGVLDPYISHIGKLIGKPSINLADTEHSKHQNKLAFPFNDKILTPDCYYDDLGPKQIKYKGYHELAYLHPNWYKPKLSLYKKYGLKKPYALVRIVSWVAAHDFGISNILSIDDKRAIVKSLSQKYNVYISAEGDLPKDLNKLRLKIPPHTLQDIIAGAEICVAEGATMASESALLGIPTVYINPLPLGYIDDLEKEGLIFQSTKIKNIIEKIHRWQIKKDLKKSFQNKRDGLLKRKIDVTSWLLEVILSYDKKQDKEVNSFFSDQANSWEKKNYNSLNVNSATFLDRADKVKNMMNITKGNEVLEIGCGPGIFIQNILEAKGRPKGMDISSSMIKQAKKKFPKIKNNFRVGDIRKTGYKYSSFDWVIAVGVLPYIQDDDLAINEISRLLKKGGRAIITFNKSTGPNVLTRNIFGVFFRLASKLSKKHSKNMLFKDIKLKNHNKKELKKLLSKNGLSIVDEVQSNYKLIPFSSLFPKLFIRVTRKKKAKKSLLANEILLKVIKK